MITSVFILADESSLYSRILACLAYQRQNEIAQGITHLTGPGTKAIARARNTIRQRFGIEIFTLENPNTEALQTGYHRMLRDFYMTSPEQHYHASHCDALLSEYGLPSRDTNTIYMVTDDIYIDYVIQAMQKKSTMLAKEYHNNDSQYKRLPQELQYRLARRGYWYDRNDNRLRKEPLHLLLFPVL